MSEIDLNLTSQDFEYLHDTAMEWRKNLWQTQVHRFEPYPLFTWEMAYWSRDYASVVLMRLFLNSRKFETQTVFDTATLEWVVLTDYKSEGWM